MEEISEIVKQAPKLRMSFLPTLLSSASITILSELGDKTFFIAAIYSMKYSHLVIFAGVIAALGIMTVLSVIVGSLLPLMLNKRLANILATAMFLLSGIQLIYASSKLTKEQSAAHELQKIEHDLIRSDFNPNGDSVEMGLSPQDAVSDVSQHQQKQHGPSPPRRLVSSARSFLMPASDLYHQKLKPCVQAMVKFWRNHTNPLLIKVFTLTMLAELGDRSQITTIALATTKNALGVAIGSIAGHALCTSIAVWGGKFLASRISEKVITFAGGCLFVWFAIWGLIETIRDWR